MDSWSISNPTGHPARSQALSGVNHSSTGLPVRSQGCTYTPTGISIPSQGCTLRQTPNQDAPLNLSPPSQVLCFNWLMIAFITCNNNLVPLLEGLCSSNPCRIEFSIFWVFANYYISYKRQHGSACVLARCGIHSCGFLWHLVAYLCRVVSICP